MSVSREASQRIRRFSVGIMVAAAVAVLGSAGTLVAATAAREAQLARMNPWDQEATLDATHDAATSEWFAEGSARITLPEELRGRPLELLFNGERQNRLEAYLGVVSEPDAAHEYLGGVYPNRPIPFAAYDDSELWIVADAPWRVAIVPLLAETLATRASGDSDAVFIVEGGVSSGQLSWEGEGTLYVTVRTRQGYEPMETGWKSTGEGSTVMSWTDSPFVVIEVNAYDGIRWTLELDEPQTPPTGAPSHDAAEVTP